MGIKLMFSIPANHDFGITTLFALQALLISFLMHTLFIVVQATVWVNLQNSSLAGACPVPA
jgi:hypothetical protein